MILDKITAKTKERVQRLKTEKPFDNVKQQAEAIRSKDDPAGDFAFEKALKADGISFICEVKKASPSKGVIAEHFPYIGIAKEYENAGAAAISVLTEPDYFMGNDRYLMEIAEQVKIPILRKDFTVDPYQIYEAKLIGASAVLLICAVLGGNLPEYIGIADSLGLSAIVEVHDETETMAAMSSGARIIGVNNRNLKTFEVDIENSNKLRPLIPEGIVFVAESGIKTREDIIRLKNTDAILIGETLMRSNDKKKMLDELKGIGELS